MRVLILMIFVVVSLFGDSVLILKKGWQLIGSPTDIKDLSIFKSSDVDQVWHYDASSQKWLGYSPDSKIRAKIKEAGFKEIKTLKSWHGFWVKSKKRWTLKFDSSSQNSDTNITLKKGWNLISLPIDSIVSAHIFDDEVVWKYTKDSEWQIFDNQVHSDFKPISYISNSDGIWVKSSSDKTISISNALAKLHNFQSIDDLKKAIKDMVLFGNQNWFGGYYPLIRRGEAEVMEDGVQSVAGEAQKSAQAPQSGVSNTTKTNIQVQGVDESDIIKHNDKDIFYLSADRISSQTVLNITTFDRVIAGEKKPLKSIKLDGYSNDIYLEGDRLVVILQNGYMYKPMVKTAQEQTLLDKGADISSMFVEIFDVSDIEDVKKIAKFKINGSHKSSRVIDGTLYLVSSFYPFVEYEYPKIYEDIKECKEYFNEIKKAVPSVESGGGETKSSSPSAPMDMNQTAKSPRMLSPYSIGIVPICYQYMRDKDGRYYRYDYEHPIVKFERLLPHYSKDNEKEKVLVDPKRFFTSNKKNQRALITTISKIDIKNASLKESSSFLGNPDIVYASTKAMYVVSGEYPVYFGFDRFEHRSAIYKFLLGDDLRYEAYGFVKGHALNQFSLDEYQDIIRIATTRGYSWQNNTINSLYTLKSIDKRLIIQGVLSGLGKEGESIRGVRFMGDKGFVVTAKITDPLYIIDLSDETLPKKIGELNVSGFSSYLHPVGSDMLLGFGRDLTPDGRRANFKIDLYDISDLSNPLLSDRLEFEQGVYSFIESDHKALSFRESDNLFALPYSKRGSYLGVFKVENAKIKRYTPLRNGDNSIYARGLIFDDPNGDTDIAYFVNGTVEFAPLSKLQKER